MIELCRGELRSLRRIVNSHDGLCGFGSARAVARCFGVAPPRLVTLRLSLRKPCHVDEAKKQRDEKRASSKMPDDSSKQALIYAWFLFGRVGLCYHFHIVELLQGGRCLTRCRCRTRPRCRPHSYNRSNCRCSAGCGTSCWSGRWCRPRSSAVCGPENCAAVANCDPS